MTAQANQVRFLSPLNSHDLRIFQPILLNTSSTNLSGFFGVLSRRNIVSKEDWK